MPHTPRAIPCLLFGREVNSNNILANVSACLLSEKSISANAFSYAKRGNLFCGSETRPSKIIAAFRHISGTGCGFFTIFNNRSTALKSYFRVHGSVLTQVKWLWEDISGVNEKWPHHLSLASFNLQSILTSARWYSAPTAAACESYAEKPRRSTNRL